MDARPVTLHRASVRKREIGPHVGKRVRLLRKQAKLTIEALATTAELDPTYVGGIERGLQNPTLRVLGRIAGALAVDLAVLLPSDQDEADIRTLRRLVNTRIAKLDADRLRLVLRLLDAVRL